MPKLMKLIGDLTEPQKKLVEQCGFGSILKLKCSNMPYKQLIIWLARCDDDKTRSIKILGTHHSRLMVGQSIAFLEFLMVDLR